MFWGVSIAPFYIAWVLASHKMVEVPGEGQAFISFILGLILIGPFLGGATLLYNDYWDYKVDRSSRRKSDYPLPQGLIPRKTVLRVAICFMIISILLSLIISILFALLVAICIVLAIIYSAPPLRIKNRPGLDLILNSIGAGILCSLAGWVVVKPLIEFPIFWLVPMFFGVASLYLPTTIIDYDSDKKRGVDTIAVRIGRSNAFLLGLSSIVIANAAVIMMGLNNYLITPEFIYFIWPVAVAQPIFYWLILRKQTFKNVLKTVVGLSILLTIGNIFLLLYYTGNFKI